jgi:hypothetical protein
MMATTMTTESLAETVLPYARHAVKTARSNVVEAVGRAGWVVLWPAWAVVTGPLLPVLVRMGVELAVALAAPRLLPVLRFVSGLLSSLPDTYLTPADRAFLVDLTRLLSTPREQLSEPVQSALGLPADTLASA